MRQVDLSLSVPTWTTGISTFLAAAVRQLTTGTYEHSDQTSEDKSLHQLGLHPLDFKA